MARAARHIVSFVLAAAVLPVVLSGHAEAQTGESVIAWHVTIAPSWFDPSTAPAQITPFGILYALHDSVVRATYGSKIGPGLAEAWSESPDGLTYEFRLRRGLKFHNGDAVTAEDVKFSFERYKGAAAKELQSRVEAIEVVNPLTVKFRLKAPWPDFMTFYGTTVSGAGLVVPKKYITQVGDEGFRKHPIGAGPFKFVSHTPGVEVVVEAYPGYWRKVSNVKRFEMKSVPEGTTRVAMLKNGEADIAYALDGEDALNVRRDSRLALIPSKHASIYWIEFADQGSDPRHRPARRQRGVVPRVLSADEHHHPARHGLRAPDPGRVLRSGEGQEATGRSRLSERIRRRRLRADAAVHDHGGGVRELPGRRRDPHQDPADRAGGLPHELAREEVARDLHAGGG